MSTPVKEHEQTHMENGGPEHIRADELRAIFAVPAAPAPTLLLAGPALLLAGEDDDGSEPHIWRGID